VPVANREGDALSIDAVLPPFPFERALVVLDRLLVTRLAGQIGQFRGTVAYADQFAVEPVRVERERQRRQRQSAHQREDSNPFHDMSFSSMALRKVCLNRKVAHPASWRGNPS
jgi:hypothetical protein